MATFKNAREFYKSALAHQAANTDLKGAIVQALADGQKTAADLATVLGVSTQKVSALARQLVEDGTITVDDVKIKGKGKVKGYTLPSDSEDEDTAE